MRATTAPARHDAVLRPLLIAWLAAGAALLALFPALRESNAWIGWLPFWLVVAPFADLLLVDRLRLLALSRAMFLRARQRRRPTTPKQARRRVRRRRARLRPLLAALLSR